MQKDTSRSHYNDARVECFKELTDSRIELQKNKLQIAKNIQHNKINSIQYFSKRYDELAQTIINKVSDSLKKGKQIAIQKIKLDQSKQSVQEKHIHYDIDSLLTKIKDHQKGLKEDSIYRQFISRIVITDYARQKLIINERIKHVYSDYYVAQLDETLTQCMYKDALLAINVERKGTNVRIKVEEVINNQSQQKVFNLKNAIANHYKKDQKKLI